MVQADAAELAPAAPFDAVLLDAPCSATGTIRRHPDVPRLKRPRDVRRWPRRRTGCWTPPPRMLRPGGRLIYSVCSLQPEEGAPRVAAALARGGLAHDPFTPAGTCGAARGADAGGLLRTLPACGPSAAAWTASSSRACCKT